MKRAFTIPASVPRSMASDFRKNYLLLTKGTHNLFLFSADHKIEHLDADFHGQDTDPAAHNPQHIFSIADRAPIGALATQVGLISRYAPEYPTITYVAKLNSTTNLIPQETQDPYSNLLWTVDTIIELKKNRNLVIAGVGATVYLGSLYENQMLEQAAQTIFQAHRNGLIAILWIYPRGRSIPNERDPELLAGAVGTAAALGADFVKIHPPKSTLETSQAELLQFICQAAGNTGVLCAGGAYTDTTALLNTIKDQIQQGGTAGAAIGRSIFKHSLEDAVSLCTELAKIIYFHEIEK